MTTTQTTTTRPATQGDTQHTPGPWMQNADTVWRKIGRNSHEIVCYPINHPNSIADARLIAAAPDLLAALVALMETEDELRDPSCLVSRAARAAIAKAKGGAK